MGAGMIIRDCPYALPSLEELRFETALGLALVITHECDLDDANVRQFNDAMLVCPIVLLADYCVEAETELGMGGWGGILPLIAADRVFRVMYLPPMPKYMNCPEMEFGGIVYLNDMSSCPLAWLSRTGSRPMGSLSSIGLRAFDYKLQNHLFREKAASLWFHRH
jgi:hypothetical protein